MFLRISHIFINKLKHVSFLEKKTQVTTCKVTEILIKKLKKKNQNFIIILSEDEVDYDFILLKNSGN